MRPSCAAPGHRRAPAGGHQQLVLVFDVDAHPLLDVAAVEVLVEALDQLQAHGIGVNRIRLEFDGHGYGHR
jgi:hypothetical protein